MKALYLGIALVSFMSLVALFSIIKFATEVSDNTDVKTSSYVQEMAIADNLVLKVTKDSGSLRLLPNHTYIASQRYPYIAAITAQKDADPFRFSCFGCVILMNWIVTAAHCRKPGHSHRILLYYDYVRNSTRTHPVVLWRVHEGYNANSTFPWHDIAVAKVAADVEPTTYAAVFASVSTEKVRACVWKTLLSMDQQTFLTNQMEIYDIAVVEPTRCYEQYGILMDESLICVDMSQHQECFVTEFGPMFTASERAVGVLAIKPKDCDNKMAVFTNVTSYFEWILEVTGTGREKRAMKVMKH